MRPAILGRLSWSPGTGEGPAGLPLLGECHCCWPVLEASPSATARRARHRCQHRTQVAAWGDSARSGMLASEPSYMSRAKRARTFSARWESRGDFLWRGPGPAQKLEFSIGPLLFRKAPVQWKTFQGAGVQRVATLWRRGLGTARVPSGLGTAPTVGGWRCGVAVLARPPAQRVALGPRATLPGGAGGRERSLRRTKDAGGWCGQGGPCGHRLR